MREAFLISGMVAPGSQAWAMSNLTTFVMFITMTITYYYILLPVVIVGPVIQPLV